MDDLGSSIEHLKQKYPLGSIYLTYIPLNDMAHLLNEEANLTQLVAEGAARQEIFQILKAFLNSKRELQMNRSIAFMQLELNTGKAGFKKISDRDGTIYAIAWSRDQVFNIAKFSDAFLNRLLAFETSHASIAAGILSLDRLWRTWEKLKADPYIPMVRKMELDRDWRSLVKEKPHELTDLKSKNPKVYEAIQTFSTNYDKSRSLLASEKALEPLRLKVVELDAALHNLKRKRKDYIALLGNKQMKDSLKIGIPLFDEAEFLMEGAGFNEEFTEIYEGLIGDLRRR